eukprot:GHVS01089293.1.p1 GENE.GHVS01089293.1~~GHVS01089293.1.p1  ORF type:complete len:101 (+),score=25.04 GHVS01089293.1:375-677(+)
MIMAGEGNRTKMQAMLNAADLASPTAAKPTEAQMDNDIKKGKRPQMGNVSLVELKAAVANRASPTAAKPTEAQMDNLATAMQLLQNAAKQGQRGQKSDRN